MQKKRDAKIERKRAYVREPESTSGRGGGNGARGKGQRCNGRASWSGGWKNIGFYGDFRRRMQNKHNSVYPVLLDCGGAVVSQRP